MLKHSPTITQRYEMHKFHNLTDLSFRKRVTSFTLRTRLFLKKAPHIRTGSKVYCVIQKHGSSTERILRNEH
jgi:hypothetical protein